MTGIDATQSLNDVELGRIGIRRDELITEKEKIDKVLKESGIEDF